MNISRLDHLVLTVADIEKTCEFYNRVLGMQIEVFGENRKALRFGNQKMNLHAAGSEFEPKADVPMPGSADLCFITDIPMPEVVRHLAQCGILVEEGPIKRTGATAPILSVYIRDPDSNLIEISNYE